MHAPLNVFSSKTTSTMSSATTILYPNHSLLPLTTAFYLVCCLLPSTVTALDPEDSNPLAAFNERRRKILVGDEKKRESNFLAAIIICRKLIVFKIQCNLSII
jgi:hypothetical protein